MDNLPFYLGASFATLKTYLLKVGNISFWDGKSIVVSEEITA
jgi:hypothetical protein